MDLITTAEAARILGVSIRRVQKLLRDGRVPGASWFGRAWTIPRKSLSAVRDRKPGRPKSTV